MTASENQSFWDHLDVLRGSLLRILAVTLAFSIIAFLFKDQLFEIVLAPKSSDFVTYRWLALVPGADFSGSFQVHLINTDLARQFIIHMKTAFCVGILCTSPYILYQLYWFVSPALYANERRYAVRSIIASYVMFMIGVLVSYFVIFPLTFRFLGTYQVAVDVDNMISLESYMSTLVMMCLSLGMVFEMPILAWIFAKSGFLTPAFMRRYRRHAIVIILTIAAIITPTSDVFTLMLVSLPMYLLYEVSIFITKAASPQRSEDAAEGMVKVS